MRIAFRVGVTPRSVWLSGLSDGPAAPSVPGLSGSEASCRPSGCFFSLWWRHPFPAIARSVGRATAPSRPTPRSGRCREVCVPAQKLRVPCLQVSRVSTHSIPPDSMTPMTHPNRADRPPKRSVRQMELRRIAAELWNLSPLGRIWAWNGLEEAEPTPQASNGAQGMPDRKAIQDLS